MAFPFIFEANFETGDASEWDSETDTVSQLDFPHFSELARFPWSTAAPFTGAFCMRAVLSGGTADAFVLAGAIDLVLAARRFVKFDIWFSPDFTGTADDTFSLFEVQSAGPVIEGAFGARIVAATNVINFGIGELAPTSFGSLPIERGVWYTVELDLTLDDGASNDGIIDLFVTREGEPAATAVHATQVASLDQLAVVQGVLGVQNHLATTTGTILFDNLRFDDARVFPDRDRFKREHLLTKSGHLFVGPGVVERLDLLSGAGTDNVATVHDTDAGNTDDAGNIKAELKNTANNELVSIDSPVQVSRGVFVALSGTNPRCLATIGRNAMGHSVANIRELGLGRTNQG